MDSVTRTSRDSDAAGTLPLESWPQLEEFVHRVLGDALPRKDQRSAAVDYLRGLMAFGRRKTMRAMAHSVGTDPRRFQHLLKTSRWDDQLARARLAERTLGSLTPEVVVIRTFSTPRAGVRLAGTAPRYAPDLRRDVRCQTAVFAYAVGISWASPFSWRLLPETGGSDRKSVLDAVGGLVRELAEEIERWRFAPLSAVPLLLEDELPLHHRPDHWPTHSRLHWIAKVAVDQGRMLIGPATVPENVRWSEPGMGPMSAHFHRVSPPSAENGGGEFILELPSSARSASAWEFDLPDADTTAVVGLVKAGARAHCEHTWLRGQLGLDAYEGRSLRGWNRHCTLVAAARRFQTEISGAVSF